MKICKKAHEQSWPDAIGREVGGCTASPYHGVPFQAILLNEPFFRLQSVLGVASKTIVKAGDACDAG